MTPSRRRSRGRKAPASSTVQYRTGLGRRLRRGTRVVAVASPAVGALGVWTCAPVASTGAPPQAIEPARNTLPDEVGQHRRRSDRMEGVRGRYQCGILGVAELDFGSRRVD